MTTPGKELLFLALGGSGEIGMNVNLYGCDGKWLMLDMGLTFADSDTPGVDLILPELEFIEKRRKDLIGIVLTHGHEDHIGALPYMAADLGVPLYATPFTAGLIAGKLEEEGLSGKVKLHIIERGGGAQLGPFKIRYVPVAHSIPEGNGVLIETPYGKVFHTGDWKIDETPVLGNPASAETLTKIRPMCFRSMSRAASKASPRAWPMRSPRPRGGCWLRPLHRTRRDWTLLVGSQRRPGGRCASRGGASTVS
jgi:ribonuclease J